MVCTATPPGRSRSTDRSTKRSPASMSPRCSIAHTDQQKSCRPVEVVRDVGHVDHAVRHVGVEGRAVDDVGLERLGERTGVLARVDPAALGGLAVVEVGDHDARAHRREQRCERLLPATEADAARARAQHAVLEQHLGDARQLPQLAVVERTAAHLAAPVREPGRLDVALRRHRAHEVVSSGLARRIDVVEHLVQVPARELVAERLDVQCQGRQLAVARQHASERGLVGLRDLRRRHRRTRPPTSHDSPCDASCHPHAGDTVTRSGRPPVLRSAGQSRRNWPERAARCFSALGVPSRGRPSRS